MVVHEDREHDALDVSTDAERLQRRKRSRAPKKRISLDGRDSKRPRVATDDGAPTVYSTLVKMLFVLSHVRPGPSDELFDVVAGWTRDGTILYESDVIALEDMFNTMDHRLNHLFHPWVRQLRIYDDAYDYMDIPFIVDVVTHSGHDYAMRTDNRSERQSVTHALALLHSHLNVPPPNRRTTL